MHKLVLAVGVMLASSATAWAQGNKKPQAAITTPTQLPGEEKLSAQERAERDFLMPVRRKHAATLRAAAEEAGASQPAVEVTARHLEAVKEEEKPAEATEAKAAPAAAPRRTSTHRSSSARRKSSSSHRTSSKKSTTKKKTTSRRRR
ncbi:hypothetical protein [Hymenobacter tenuis]